MEFVDGQRTTLREEKLARPSRRNVIALMALAPLAAACAGRDGLNLSLGTGCENKATPEEQEACKQKIVDRKLHRQRTNPNRGGRDESIHAS